MFSSRWRDRTCYIPVLDRRETRGRARNREDCGILTAIDLTPPETSTWAVERPPRRSLRRAPARRIRCVRGAAGISSADDSRQKLRKTSPVPT